MIRYPYSKPEITKADISAINKVLKKGYLTQGPVLEDFEKNISIRFRSKYSIVCNSGTAALHLVYYIMGVGPRKSILTSPITFLATANAAKMCNARVYFADVDQNTGILTPSSIEKALKKYKGCNIGVISVVHLGGQVCDMQGIKKVAKKYNCLTVEDACHAPGVKTYDSFVGSCKYSDVSTFSFHAIKHIAMGEGGCITTNDKNFAEKAKLLRNHGMIKDKKKMLNLPEKNPLWYYEMHELGWNYRADEISCSLGLSQLKRLNKNLKKRRILASKYFKYLSDTKNLSFTSLEKNINKHGWHLFSVLINFDKINITRGSFMQKLASFGIGSQVHYIPLFKQTYYKNSQVGKFDGAIKYYNKTISLPLYVQLNVRDIKFISSKVKEIIT